MRITAKKPYHVMGIVLVAALAAPAWPVAASDMGRAAAARVSQESYRHFLVDVLYTHAGDNRGFGSEHDLTRDAIVAWFQSFGLTVELHPFDYLGDTYYNVVGTKLGTLYPDQIYIIGAHMDSVNNPGADDNASGVSLVLEAARVLSEFDSAYTIRFIAFDREEQGLIGSEAYAFDHIDDDIVGMVSADMVAYNSGAESVDIQGRVTSDPWKTALASAVLTYGQGLNAAVLGRLDASDHAPFEWYGFQACLIIEDWGNPNYHTSRDNVDEPDYIDYAYATRVTRTTVGFLVDQAAVAVPILGADYDGDGDVDLDDYNMFVQCFGGTGTPPTDPDCGFFDLDTDGDVDCTDWELLTIVWTGPGDPPAYWRCNLHPAVADRGASRCLVVVPPESERPMALLVVGDPYTPTVSCVSKYVQPDGSLGSAPVFQTSSQWGTTIICDEDIVPSTAYEVYCDYGEPGAPVLSPKVRCQTEMWADAVGQFSGTQWPPPDGTVNLSDVLAILQRFANTPGAPPSYRVDLVGLSSMGRSCAPDGRVQLGDALAALRAFSQLDYWESTACPPPCGP